MAKLASTVPNWQILDRRLTLDRSPYVRVYDTKVQLPDGTIINDFVRVEIQPFVMVLALLDDGRVPMVQQYRLSIEGVMLELPAGLIEPDEDILDSAQRELREETGAEAAEWQFLGKYVMDANKQCGWGYMYLARGATQVVEPNPGDLGEMSVHFVELAEVRRMFLAGELMSAPTALCIGLALGKLAQ